MDFSNVRDILNKIFTMLFVDLIFCLIPFIVMLSISYKFIYIFIFMMITYILTFIFLKEKIKNNILELKEEDSKVNSFLVETINSLETIRNLNIKNYVCSMFRSKYEKLTDKIINYNLLLNKKYTFFEIISNLFIVLFFCYSIFLIKANILKISNIITIYLLSNLVINSLENISELLFEIVEGSTSFQRIKELCDIENENLKEEDYIKNFSINNIVIRNLNYTYDEKRYLLNNINLNIQQGEKLLICGDSGIGKSTLMKILSGLLDDYEGNILINGISLKNISKINLRENITYISQDENLFSTSIRKNIEMGKNISDERRNEVYQLTMVNEILKNRNISDDFLLEENAFNISGGEKQRIVLARSILKNSDLYILDESLCNMDVSLEREVLNNLFKYYKEKTIIVISHRFNNDDLFDRKITL